MDHFTCRDDLRPLILPLALLAFLPAQQSADATMPPATAHLRYTAGAHGVQIYSCDAKDNSFQWVFQAPEAVLFDPATNQQLGTHGAGPKWTWADGSSITGKVIQKQPSNDPAAIPWLLVETHAATDAKGALADITLVRRSDTQAGSAPATGCDAQHQGNVVRVPYAATYTFYSTSP